ncbi:hypothetical protein LLG96_15500 [bacterium]|nr:hypothetical protein [bacterium]
MQTVHYISATVILMGAVQGIFFALLLLGIKQEHKSSNSILAALLIMMATGFISMFGVIVSKSQLLIGVFHVLMLMIIVCIPLLYLYVKTITIRDFRLSKRSAFHFLPVVLGILYLLMFNAPLYDLADALALKSFDHTSVIRILWILYAPPYLFSVQILIKRHSHRIAESYLHDGVISHVILYELNVHLWVRTLLVACWVYWLLSIVSFIFRNFAGYCSTFIIVSAFMMYLLGFLALQKPMIFYRPDISLLGQKDESQGGAQ